MEGNAAISSPSWPADKPPVGPRMGADRVRHLHSSDGLVNEQVESGSTVAKPHTAVMDALFAISHAKYSRKRAL